MRRRFAYENQNSCQWFAASIHKARLWRCNGNSVVGNGLGSSCLVVGFSFAQGHQKAHLQIPWNPSSLSQQQQQWQEFISHKLQKNFVHNLQHSKQAPVPILSWGVTSIKAAPNTSNQAAASNQHRFESRRIPGRCSGSQRSHDVTDQQSVSRLDGQGVWIDHLQACSGNKNGLQFSCHIALHSCYFQWKISAMAVAAAAAACLRDAWGRWSCGTE